ncbi:MAG: lipoprotein signal peptidase [Bacteroidales bacterium]|nr:lipoprotein signal peptidase [Bacteroidales bacterium]
MTKGQKALLLIVVVLVVDQISKILVKTNMQLYEFFSVAGDWFYIRYLENSGMAFGWKFAGVSGKVFLTLFRIVASIFIGWYIFKLLKKDTSLGVILGVSLVFAGAVGNIIDSTVYGLIFDTGTVFNTEYGGWMSYRGVSSLNFQGYSSVFQGCVVDMLHFPIIDTFFPDWMPMVGGQKFVFFSPIFNIADSAITVGVAYLILFQRSFFKNI